ncbi:MAG: hypothetical protein IV100_10220 [Myxococcales bacterium]|nr:hypothetical protein [Myxococcales bacterium]
MSTRFQAIVTRPTFALVTFVAVACAAPAQREAALRDATTPTSSTPSSLLQLASRESGGGIPGPAAPVPGGLQDALEDYIDAYQRGDWPAVWGFTATTERESLIALGRHPAERSRETARAQGFASSDDVRAVTDEAWFTANRTALAKAGRLPTLPTREGLRAIDVSPVVLPGAAPGRSTVAVSFQNAAGAHIIVGAVMQGSDWRFLSPRASTR